MGLGVSLASRGELRLDSEADRSPPVQRPSDRLSSELGPSIGEVMMLQTIFLIATMGVACGDSWHLERELVPPTPSLKPRAFTPGAAQAPSKPSGPVASIGVSGDAKIVAASFRDGESWLWSGLDAVPVNADVSNDAFAVPLVAVSDNGIVWIVKRSDVHCLRPGPEGWIRSSTKIDYVFGEDPTSVFASASGEECYVGFHRTGGLNIAGRDTWDRGLLHLGRKKDGSLTKNRIQSKDILALRIAADGTVLATTKETHNGMETCGVALVKSNGSIQRLNHGPCDRLLAIDKSHDGEVVAVSVQDAVPNPSKAWVGLVFERRYLPIGERKGGASRAVAAPGPIDGSFAIGFQDGVFIVVEKDGNWRGEETKAHSAPVTAVACARRARMILSGAKDGSLKAWKLK